MLVQAADAAEVRSSASITASSDANMKMEAALSAAGDVPTFAARRALNILQVWSIWSVWGRGGSHGIRGGMPTFAAV